MKTKHAFFLVLFLFITILSFADDGYNIGDYVSDFNLKNVDGDMISLADFEEAKGFIVIFTCNTCPYAQKYEQRIIDLHERFSKQGFPVIAINPNDPIKSSGDSFDKMQTRATEKNYPFPYLQDEDQKIAKNYGATRTPEVYLLAKHNDKLKLIYTGAIDDNYRDPKAVKVNYIQQAINSFEQEEEIKETKTKAIGCTIKWKS